MFRREKKKIRYAVIGLGIVTQKSILPAFEDSSENSELVALVSSSPEKLNFFGAKYNIQEKYLLHQVDDLFQKKIIDAIYVRVPGDVLKKVAELAIKYDINIICDKPFDLKLRNYRSKIMVTFHSHFEAANLEAIHSTHANQLGSPRIFNSLCTSTNIDYEQFQLMGLHLINMARSFFQNDPIEVFAMASRSLNLRFINREETVSYILKFPEGKMANLAFSFTNQESANYEIIGTDGRIQVENAYQSAKSMTLRNYEKNRIITKKYPRRENFSKEIIYFSDCINKNKTPNNSLTKVENDLRIMEALQLSLDLTTPITIEDANRRKRNSFQLPQVEIPRMEQ